MSQIRKNKIPIKHEENLFMQTVSRYITYWPLFIILIVFCFAGAYFYIRYATPKYEANATIIIKDEKKGADDSKAMDALNMMNTKKIIENEIEVLQSRVIMQNVVKQLGLYAPIYQEGKIRAQCAYSISPIKIEIENPDSIVPVKKVFLRFDQKNSGVYLNNKFTGSINEWLNTPYGRLRFIINRKFTPSSEMNKPFYFSLENPDDITKKILSSLTVVSVNKLSSIIDLTIKDDDPDRAEDILNNLIFMYNKASVDERNSLAQSTLQFVDQRLNSVSGDLDSIERKVQSFKAASGASDISTQGQLYLQNVSNNDQQLGKINMELAVLNQVDDVISAGNSNAGAMMTSTVGISDPNLLKLMTDLNNKELEYERLRKTVAENNPLLVSLKDQINKIRPSIAENLKSQRQNLETSKGNLTTTNSKYNSILSSIPQKERELLDISRDQNIKKGIYSFLLQKKEESELSYASTLSDSRVINDAQASKTPVSPKKLFIYLGAFGFALAIGFLFITASEGLTRTILYRKDLEGFTNVPILGEIAFNETKESIVIEAGKRSFIAEEFRKIRVSLHFLGIDSTHKKILVTSSIPGEGKSFVSANLAISNALTGKKVALIDVDLHNPGLGKTFGKTTADAGLSDYLMGKKKPEDIIKKVPGHENLYFVSSGTLHESPSELLLNGKINEFVEYLESRFDFIVLDTAPSVLITDAFILTNLCDATMYVVRHKYTPKMLIKRIDDNLEINPLKNPAIIFNGVKKRGFFKNNYGYGYDYVYGGKYLPDDKKSKKKKNI